MHESYIMENKRFLAILGIVLVFIVLVSSLGSLAPTITDAAESITDANNCSESTDSAGVELTYNLTNGYCYNSTGTNLFLAGQYDLPLNGLFSSSGVMVLILMVGFLVSVVGYVLYKRRR